MGGMGLGRQAAGTEAGAVNFRKTSKTGVRSSGFFTPVAATTASRQPGGVQTAESKMTATFKYQTSTSKNTGEFAARASLDVKRR